ncbi:protein of unknown function [Chryseobacterium sp. JV274]|nr:protein of unknown function [Chryseobacterium sp. JV274]
MMAMGKGRNIELKHLIKLGEEVKLSKTVIKNIIEQTKHALNQWKDLSSEYGVTQSNIELIHRMMTRL